MCQLSRARLRAAPRLRRPFGIPAGHRSIRFSSLLTSLFGMHYLSSITGPLRRGVSRSRVLLFGLLAVLAAAPAALAQNVGIGTTAPDASAALDIVSSSKGALLPRVADATAIATPATGLLVFQTGAPAGFYYNAGTPAAPSWQQLATGAGVPVTAGNGLTKTGSTIGLGGTLSGATTIAQAGNAFSLTGGSVGIGTTAPTRALEVAGQVFSSTGGFRFPDGSVQTSAAAPTVGDIKQGLQAADHAGWVKLDGRSVSTLTSTQRARATALGLFTNLPDATNRVLKQESGTLLDTGGSNTAAIGQNNLPSVNLTGMTEYTGGHSHSTAMTRGFAAFSGSGSVAVYGPGGATFTSAPLTSNTAGYHQHTVTVALGGSSASLPVEDAYLNVNQFLYLGL